MIHTYYDPSIFDIARYQKILDSGKKKTPSPYHRRLVGYYPSWIDKENKPEIYQLQLPRELTHFIYALVRVKKQGTLVPMDAYQDLHRPFLGGESLGLTGNYGQLQVLKKHHPHLCIMLLLGGSNTKTQGGFAAAAATPESRKQFSENVVHYLRRWPVFEGVDVDWEFPGGDNPQSGGDQDKVNFTLLMQTLRDYLSVEGKRTHRKYQISIALGAYQWVIPHLEVDKLSEYVDFITIMTYDFHGPTQKVTGHNTPLYDDPCAPIDQRTEYDNVSASLQRYIQAGAPLSKLHMGIAFYGYGWADCCPRNFGEYQRALKKAKGNTDQSSGTFDQPGIQKLLREGAQSHFNERAKVPFLWDPKQNMFITHENKKSVAIKVDWALRNHLGGLSIWTLGEDPKQSLLRTMVRAMKKNLSSKPCHYKQNNSFHL